MTLLNLKKTKDTKKCVEKQWFKSYKPCLKATQLGNKINQFEKNKVDGDSLGGNHEEFIKKLYINTKITANI